MNAVGIDVSKGKSTIAIMRPFGEVVASPYDVGHTESELKELARFLKSLPGETRVLMEYTGRYYEPIAQYLHEAGIFVSVVNALLVHDYGGNSLRKVKTDKKDALKLASYALDRWTELEEYIPADEQRKTLKMLNRQYNQSNKIQTMMKNNLISLTDSTFPGINKLFTSPERQSDGHEKWVDFLNAFPHKDCVAKLYLSAFKTKYKSWCKKNKYNYTDSKAEEIHTFAKSIIAVLPLNDSVELLITQAVTQLNTILETVSSIRKEMDRIASSLPEYETVMAMYGVGKVYGPQLMAEIGDTRRFRNRRAITAFAGLDAPPFQSGQLDVNSRHISKRGSAALRKVLFQITEVFILNKPEDEPVYQFIDRKRSEGKHYYSYRIAAANKFLRIYYAKVNQVLESQ